MSLRLRLFLLATLLLSPITLLGGTKQIARAAQPVKDQYIVRFTTSVTDLRGGGTDIARAHGGRALDFLPGINAALVTMTDAQAQAMNRNPLVYSVEENALGQIATMTSPQTGVDARLSQNPNSPASSWGLDRIDQVSPQSSRLDNSYSWCYDGAGVQIYVVDTGVLPFHSEFGGPDASRVQFRTGLSDMLKALTPPNDIQPPQCWAYSTPENSANASHGTAVASIAAGETLGLAKGATIVDARAVDCSGHNITSFRIMKVIEWICQDPLRSPGRAVINLSFSGAMNILNPQDDNNLQAEIYTAAETYNIPVVSAAGNNGTNAYWYWPGNANGSITVGGLSKNADTLWQIPAQWQVAPDNIGTNFSYTTSFYAPAEYVEAASTCTRPIYNNAQQQVYIGCSVLPSHDLYRSELSDCEIGPNGNKDPFGCTSGTSFAAPHMSGVIARYLQAHPGTNWRDIKSTLTALSSVYGGAYVYDGSTNTPVLTYRDCP